MSRDTPEEILTDKGRGDMLDVGGCSTSRWLHLGKKKLKDFYVVSRTPRGVGVVLCKLHEVEGSIQKPE